MSKNIPFKILIYVFIAILMVVYLFPLFYALNTSIRTKLDYMANPTALTTTFHFENYVQAFQKANL